MNIDHDKPVLVTGATGYIAGVLIRELLELGRTVHATVRDPTNTEKFKHLTDLGEKLKGDIKFFKGDLMEEGSFAEGMKGCSVVFHTASPFVMKVEDPQKDLVDPAVKGTKNVLNQASLTPSVKRVVLTSSCAAIHTDAKDTYSAPNDILTEEIWNTTASLSYQPYFYSKTLAEQAAWVIAGSQTQWSLVTINPALVMGPGIKVNSGESYNIAKQMGDGTLKSGTADFCLGVVDVREVAHAHIEAAFQPLAKGRHILVGHCTSFPKMAAALREKYPDYPVPTRTIPKFIVWLMGPWIGMSRKYVSRNVGWPLHFDNSKSKEELGVKYRSLEDTMQDMFAQLIEEGVVKKD